MRIGLRLLLGFFMIVAVAGYFVMNIFVQEVKPGVRRATEGMMVDTANLLAQIAEQDIRNRNLNQGHIAQAFSDINRAPIGAKIDHIVKNRMEYRVYITDSKGKVIFDSTGEGLGQDYSRWNDVYLTLRGKYGARSTRLDPEDESSSVMYVAAPIKTTDGQIIGSLTVSKPNQTMQPVIRRSERRMEIAGIILLGIALLIGAVFVWWINRSISRLVRYASEVAEGNAPTLPKMDGPELSSLAHALESMRIKLEGKDYIEKYVHTLTHELKSPLAAIRGAAEILQEMPPQPVAQRFINNIKQQNERLQLLVDRMLQQAQVESRIRQEKASVDLAELLNGVIDAKEAQFAHRQITVSRNIDAPVTVRGDKLLLEQAFSNLLENALDFTPEQGKIIVTGEFVENHYRVIVIDNGPGMPVYALDKVFDRFYSLPRPDKEKSTGLGLSFVREVAIIHQGTIHLVNGEEGGAKAIFILPMKDK
ncbi:two-component system sensor histidine kinase CreC [Pragia fontium]|uniref:histidine kinase n=2 Tax=Pragia fontium TaxID=82985 RepID=A0AAJ5BFY1_9GAMM|nr:two-component system sensor histidine kinase CreC [Pragia fontium]GKX62756.1 two-component sensor histidine kinase [Pragia fontium]SFC09249.1 two-component system, OmpR family, sensor histidine kinase CreC [Pragia fontium DSM 5563 = ATCC 49100]